MAEQRPRLIVPVVGPREEAVRAAAGTPNVTYHNGPLLTAVKVITIFWGADWATPGRAALITGINNFFDSVLTSSLMDVMAEYSVPGKTIGHGSRIGTKTIASPEPGAVVSGVREVTDAQIQTQLQQWINANTIAAPTANTLYFVYLPVNVVSTMQDSTGVVKSCAQFCGYHSHIPNTSTFYAVEPFLTCDGCIFGTNQPLDSLTKVSSHELCEAVTDPAANGWFDGTTGDEIGDICNTSVATLGGFEIQSEWSQKAAACVSAPGATPPATTPPATTPPATTPPATTPPATTPPATTPPATTPPATTPPATTPPATTPPATTPPVTPPPATTPPTTEPPPTTPPATPPPATPPPDTPPPATPPPDTPPPATPPPDTPPPTPPPEGDPTPGP
jgi:hypothetical protein